MTTRYPGGLIRKTPPTITPPVGGEGGSAPGVWTLEQASYYTKQGTWPLPILPKALYSVGENSNGTLGLNDVIDRSSPVQIGSGTNWSLVSGTYYAALALKADGTLWSWGAPTNGQLGLNDNVSRSSPTQIGALTNWASIALSTSLRSFNLAIKTDGTLWAWGVNSYGELGQNDKVYRSSPVQVGADTNWASCWTSNRVSFAIKTNGALYSWGGGFNGESGQNDTVFRSSPTQIGALTTWSKGSSGSYFTHVIKTDGTIWGFGYQGAGIGDGAIGVSSLVTYSSPVQVGALTTWSKTYNGSYAMYAIKTDNTLWTCGGNTYGELGQNNIVNQSSPVQIGSSSWSSIGGGFYFVSAIKTDKTVWSWGYNNVGQLGLNDLLSKSSPVQIGSSSNWGITNSGLKATYLITKG